MPKRAERIATVPPYLFAEIDNKKKAAIIARGVDVISLAIGDPDQPTPAFVVTRMQQAIQNPSWHQYPDYEGSLAFRRAATSFYMKRFGVVVDPKTECLALIGSKEGLAHIVWSYVDPGDYVLVPDPAYPVYKTHTGLLVPPDAPAVLGRARPLAPEAARIPATLRGPRGGK